MRPFFLVPLLATLPVHAAELQINVTGIRDAEGQIGCALHAPDTGFPMDAKAAIQIWLPANPAGVTCRFPNVTPGIFAIAVSHDRNGNGKTDTNLFGMPKEDWGVSNDVRPQLRAPRFEEAAVRISTEERQVIEVRLGR
jgi:uncharacterized protein (DUF2141 family)